jgi:hypothetical protein
LAVGLASGQARERRVRPREQVGGLHERALEVARQPLVALLDLLPVLGQRGFGVGDLDHEGVGRQVVEQRAGALEEQRQPGLDAARHEALADFAVDPAAQRVAREIRAIALAEQLDRGRVGREFACGHEPDLAHRAGRALGLGVERADRLDLVAEQVDPVGQLAAHREQVDQRAAHGEFALHLDLADRLVARRDQPLAERLRRQRVADTQLEAPALEPGPRRERLDQRVGRGHEHAAPLVRQAVERGEPRRQDFLVRREVVVRQHFGVGQVHHRMLAGQEETQLLLEPVSLLLAAADREDRARMAACRVGDRERDARPRQRGPAQAFGGRGQRQFEDHGDGQKHSAPEGTGRRSIALRVESRPRRGTPWKPGFPTCWCAIATPSLCCRSCWSRP